MTIIPRPSPNHGKRPAGVAIDCVVLHADAGRSEEGTLGWLANPDSGVSYHYLVGRWQDVHDRFLATLEAEGVGRRRRTLMHRAVWYFGPRWPVHQSITVADLAEIAHRPLGPNGRPWGDYPGRAA